MVSIGDAELEVLKVLWEHGPNTVREVNGLLEAQGHTWAYTTVMTMLNRLREKGVVGAERVGNANRFKAVLSRDRIVRLELSKLMDRLCGGGASPLMLALVEEGRFDQREIAEFRALLDRLEKEQGPDRD